MLSDSLRYHLPRLLGTTYDYLLEKNCFDYGEVGEDVSRVLAELIVLTSELDARPTARPWLEEPSLSPLRRDFNLCRYLQIIEKYRSQFDSEWRNFKPLFDHEVAMRKALPPDLHWINPEFGIRKDDLGTFQSKSAITA